MKIDIFNHFLPAKYKEALSKTLLPPIFQSFQVRGEMFPALVDVEKRFLLLDKHEGLVQALSMISPFVERYVSPRVAIDLVRLGNDELAELVAKYPDRFVAAIGNLPMNDLAASLDEADRIIKELHFKGIQICTDINGKPLDMPEFMPLWEKMAQYDLPIFLHPSRPPTVPDYSSENVSKYTISQMLGWPYDTSTAMIRLVLAQVLQKYPHLKFVTHHCGGMVPFFYKRIGNFLENPGNQSYVKQLSMSPLDYLRKFYGDTALTGCTSSLMCGYDFFGADQIVFGTDMPMGSHGEHSVLDEVIESVEQMEIQDAEKEKIYSVNAMKLLKLKL